MKCFLGVFSYFDRWLVIDFVFGGKYARGRSFAAIRFDDLDTGFNYVPRWLVGCKYIVLSEFSSYKKGYVFEILIIKLLLSLADSRV